MDTKNPYTMAKLGLEAKENLQPKRDCSFYVKYFFLFLSLIQFLIILGLVLFMIYGSPQASNETQIKGLTSLLQKAEGKAEALGKEVAELKRKLNASQTETALLRRQLNVVNVTLRSSNTKAEVAEWYKYAMIYYHNGQECWYQLQILNATCPVKVTSLEEKLKALEEKSQLAQNKFAQESQALRKTAELAEKEKMTCQSEKLQLQTWEEKYRELESKVTAELGPVRQSLVSAVDRAFSPTQFGGCYLSDLNKIRDVCQDLPNIFRSQLATLTRQVDQKVSEVAQENRRLQSQREACAHDLQERDRRLAAQQQLAEREKQTLREAQAAEAKRMEAEQQKLAREKEDLKGQLEISKQFCMRTRVPPGNIPPRFPPFPPSSGGTNPFPSFPGGSPNLGGFSPGGVPAMPNPYGQPPPWPRPGLPSSGSQGPPSHADRMRLQEPKKDAPEVAKIPNQPPVTGQRSG